MKIQKIKPDPNCPICHGVGIVKDWVDYGSTVVSLDSYCNCVEAQADPDTDEIELEEADVY